MAAINTASATDRSTYAVYLPQVREYRYHMAGMVSATGDDMSSKTEAGAGLSDSRADALVAAYFGRPRKYIVARRDAAMMHAGDSRHTNAQKSYWLRVANGCTALLVGAQP